MIEIHGHCSDKFAAVKTAFQANFTERDEIGASVAITHGGEFVVDLWAERARPHGAWRWQVPYGGNSHRKSCERPSASGMHSSNM